MEVSVGTGRNMKYYPPASEGKVKSVTFVDVSYRMLEQCIKSFEANRYRFETGSGREREEIPSRFVHVNLSHLDLADNSYDTVIETFGLCSLGPEHGPRPEKFCKLDDCNEQMKTSHPVRLLNELARVCKPNGRVLLLEHGRASPFYERLLSINKKMDEGKDVHHFNRWGCWANRDIEDLIEQSDLEIEYIQRWNFGTTYYIIARPKKKEVHDRDEQ